MAHNHGSHADRVLLPTNVKPLKYHIHLTPNLQDFTFQGVENVEIEVREATSKITIHSLDIKIHSASVSYEGKDKIPSNNITFDEKEETVTLSFPSELPVGKAKLTVEYQGNLNDQMMGFYRSKYTLNGEQKWMATTQFEPTGARRAFPGWDEPAVKAVFDISLTFPENLLALSNMDPTSESVSNGLKTIHFASSPIMSTYLVAFVVGEFDFVESKTNEGVRVRVYTPVGRRDTGLFSLDVATRTLSYFTEYFGVPYPLPKMDMIAIADFAAGAMENWGLVTYRETALLIDNSSSGVAAKARVAYVVAHELAHQWFGNLVTMEWWKELWLNEGFATFVGNQAIDHLFPSWDIWTQFISDHYNTAQSLDGLENSHPIEVEVRSSAQIEEIFDSISYNKGASVIRMISDQIGEDKFRKGLNIYLNRHKYKNAVTEDLWNALGEASGYDVKNFMDAYTKTTGYPLVTVESTGNPCQFKISQQRFFSSGKPLSTEEANQVWWVSIPVATSKNPKQVAAKYDVKGKEATVTFDVVEGSEWFKANAGQSGFFRVRYSADLSAKLTAPISNLTLGPVDRIGVQNDAFALSVAGFLPLTDALNLAKAYASETEYTVWSDLAANLNRVSLVWSEEPNHEHFKKFLRGLFTEVGKRLGWDAKADESDLSKLLRVVVLAQLGNNGDADVINEAKKRFKAQISENSPIVADLRPLVYKFVVANGDVTEYEQVLNIYKTAEMHEEKIRALRALGSAKSSELTARTLEFLLSDDVRAQDIFIGLHPITQSPAGRVQAWNFMKSRWSDFIRRLGSSAMLLDRTISYTTSSFVTEDKAAEIKKFFEENPVPSAERTIKQVIETITVAAKWLKNNREDVAKWLEKQ